MRNQRLLFSLAHPDDEAFGSGGLIAKYTSEGAQVSLICATDGARGTIDQKFLDEHGSHSAVRYAELDCAAEKLGFHEVIRLDYRDSGMMGSPENDDPESLWQQDERRVAGQIVATIRRLKPQVVVTFDPYGGYGHPDHIFMHRATTRAFHAAGDAEQFPEAGAPYAPQKLYYTAFPRLTLRVFILLTRLRGEDPRALGINKDLDLIAIQDNLLKITTRVLVAPYLAQGEAAARCHASQLNPSTSTPRWVRRFLGRHQTLTRAEPAPAPREPRERDLFAGVS
ncbi:MAG: PIG-L family deacetylase [Anaerolineales bacterium]